MSNDHLLLSLDQNAQALAPLRQSTPLYAAIGCLEDVGLDDPMDSLRAALSEYIRTSAGPVAVVHSTPFSTGIAGFTYALTVFTDGAVPADQRETAYRVFLPLAHRMSGLLRELPDRTRERLGIREVIGAPVHDWVWVLFHLAWHFPAHFARGVVHRDRLLQTEHGPFVAPEEWVQLGCVVAKARDLYPGLIFSRFPRELDLVSATAHAIELFRQAVRGGGAFQVTDALRDQLRRWHREFVSVGELEAQHTRPTGRDLEVRVLRLDSSFRTPPAAQWAGYEAGGAVQRTLLLSHLRAIKEVCVLRGPFVNDFIERAERVGAILPAWPNPQAVPLLGDAAGWLSRVNRRRELESQQFYFATPDGSSPAGEPVPRSQVVEHVWSSTRMSPGWGGLVTDHRGNLERWLGFVFYMLKEFEPDAIEIRTFPDGEGRHVFDWNAMLTLREMNLFQASARAMELAGLVWLGTDGNGGAPSSQGSAAGPLGTRHAVHFDDPWASDGYPPPAAGRYIRFYRGQVPGGCEPEWSTGWTWTERPEDGWVECGQCGVGENRAFVGRGRPPTVCDWLPAEWPAGYFPLGNSAEHCAGWRELVRSVLEQNRDTIPPEDREYGWLTLTRATRQLAHHLGVIPLERLLAPLPASRVDARREVDPLLDGIVLARRNPSRPAEPLARAEGTSAATRSENVGTTSGLAAEVERLLADARVGFAGAASDFTIVAVPAQAGPAGGNFRCQRCDDNSPDTGQLRDGVFYWPFASLRAMGFASIDDLGQFGFAAFDKDGKASSAFAEFCGRAAAALLAAAPPWIGLNRPSAGVTTWSAAIMFLSPSARTQTTERANGARVLSNPWAASIAALRDILHPPAPVPAPSVVVNSVPAPRDVPCWEDTARRLLFRGQECKRFVKPAPNQEKVLAAFQEEGWPDAIDDPLPSGKLATTVESLNDRLQHIKFTLNGACTGVCWQPV